MCMREQKTTEQQKKTSHVSKGHRMGEASRGKC